MIPHATIRRMVESEEFNRRVIAAMEDKMDELKPTSAADDLRPAQRCAECDCENGGADCNWIKAGPALPDDDLWEYWSEMATRYAGKYDTLKAENAAQAARIAEQNAEIARLREALAWCISALEYDYTGSCPDAEIPEDIRAALEGKSDE